MGAIWVFLFAIVLFGVFSAPDFDVLKSLQKYKVVGQQYLDRKEIDLSPLKVENPDDELVLIYAKYMQAFQISENKYDAEHSLLSVALAPQNISKPEQAQNAYQRLENLSKQTQDSYDILLNAQKNAVESLKLLKGKKLEVYGPVIDDMIEEIEVNEVKFRDNVTKSRLALEKYCRALIDFYVQKQGAFTVQGATVFFATPEDQQYYDQLKQGQKTYEQEITQAFEKYQQDLRESNSKIPVDIK